MRYLLILPLALLSCGRPQCDGITYSKDSAGNLVKYNEYYQEDQHACMSEKLALSQWESSLESRRKKGVVCTPQASSKTYISASNYYSYRDSKVYLDLDKSGEYRRLVLGEDQQGAKTFTKQLGCYYERAGQLLLDSDDVAGSEAFNPMEIFSVASAGSGSVMTRFDASQDWTFMFCPYLDTPWDFCNALRNGNEMFWPTLPVQTQTDLANEAMLIRKVFSFSSTSRSAFEAAWSSPAGTEKGRNDWKYAVIHVPDTPRYIDQAWREYVKGTRPTMPDITSSQVPPLCYPGSQTVTLANGNSGKVYGEVCFVDGQYTFTPN